MSQQADEQLASEYQQLDPLVAERAITSALDQQLQLAHHICAQLQRSNRYQKDIIDYQMTRFREATNFTQTRIQGIQTGLAEIFGHMDGLQGDREGRRLATFEPKQAWKIGLQLQRLFVAFTEACASTLVPMVGETISNRMVELVRDIIGRLGAVVEYIAYSNEELRLVNRSYGNSSFDKEWRKLWNQLESEKEQYCNPAIIDWTKVPSEEDLLSRLNHEPLLAVDFLGVLGIKPHSPEGVEIIRQLKANPKVEKSLSFSRVPEESEATDKSVLDDEPPPMDGSKAAGKPVLESNSSPTDTRKLSTSGCV
ncbi:hypothetical protein BU16DRAFT_542650 [Lophium mytilinum]|uniref:Uncharacterized protein n=1 Tax=Lophium mytilinum TaxID=390894 RepID=A0A6A6QJB1_9PEZI|nr:hypothetical protein BU16DRAFT_542650 [Lophium mytilinum]